MCNMNWWEHKRIEFTPKHSNKTVEILIRKHDKTGELSIRLADLTSCLEHFSEKRLSISEPYYHGVTVQSLLDVADCIRKIIGNDAQGADSTK